VLDISKKIIQHPTPNTQHPIVDFSVIFQLRTKKFWWMDVVFYFVISSLIATVLCYVIFLTKNNLQREDIKKETAVLQTVGTGRQKEYEKSVITYQKKINDFTNLLKIHKFASNVFAFMQEQTMPNVWFKQFSLDEKNNGVQLSGEADDMSALSRQVSTLEKNKYVKNIGTLSSTLGESARIEFSVDITLDQNIFNYLSSLPPILENVTPSEQSLLPTGVPAGQTTPTGQTIPANQQVSQPQGGALSSEKQIISFDFLLNPKIIGAIDETNHAITLNVPFGTYVKNLKPSIIISAGSKVSPSSNNPQDFTGTVTYSVTAQDGSIQNYGVKVIIEAQQKVVKKSNQSVLVVLIIIVLVIIAIAITFLFLRRKSKNSKQIKVK
jgi:hypothetical protein